MQLASQLPQLSLSMVDPRKTLSSAIDDVIQMVKPPVRLEGDPVSYASRSDGAFDIIIVNSGAPDSYRNARLVTPNFLEKIKRLLAPEGVVYYPTSYDTDRYVTQEQSGILSIYFNTLDTVFDAVHVWPGNMTLFFAGDTASFDLSLDTLAQRVGSLGYKVSYLDELFLRDRLGEFRMERLNRAPAGSTLTNDQNQPILPHYQAIYRAGASGADSMLVPLILSGSLWIMIIPALILAAFFFLAAGKHRRRRYGFFLYLTAGLVSLSLELVSFYLYQSMAGSLYSELAALVGAFMFGLAVGTWFAQRAVSGNLELPSLILLLAATLLFLSTGMRVDPYVILIYHVLFQFTVALATGGLFVAATRRYYATDPAANRGAGYAVELVGSSVGALLATTVFLPLIGLQWLLLSLCGILVLALIGAVLTARG
jgi:spermidine synthase